MRWRGERKLRPQPGEEPAAVIARLQAAGVDTGRAPPMALGEYIRAHAPVESNTAFREKGRYSKRNAHTRWMMEKG